MNGVCLQNLYQALCAVFVYIRIFKGFGTLDKKLILYNQYGINLGYNRNIMNAQ